MGTAAPKPGESLKNTTLTQFAPEAWTGLYAPLFMFDGTWRLDYDEGERLYRARLGALFRNALDPGQYPYPFWHDAKKWNDYQSANTLILWIAPQSGTIVVGQFTNDGQDTPSLKSAPSRGRRSTDNGCGPTPRAPASRRRRCFVGCFRRTTPISGSWSPPIESLRTPCAGATATTATCRTIPVA